MVCIEKKLKFKVEEQTKRMNQTEAMCEKKLTAVCYRSKNIAGKKKIHLGA